MRANRLRRRSVNPTVFVTVASGAMRRNAASRAERNGGRPSTPDTPESNVGVGDVTELAKTLQVGFIPKYLDYMFYIGGSIYTHAAASHRSIVKNFNKVVFGVVSLCAFLDGFLTAKYFGLKYLHSNKLEDYVAILSCIMCAYARIYLVLTMINDENLSKVYRILGSMKRSFKQPVNVDDIVTRFVLATSLIIVCGRTVLPGMTVSLMNFHDVFSYHAFANAHVTTVWTTRNYRNVTADLGKSYWPDAEDANYFPLKIFHGLWGLWLLFCSVLHDTILEDILLLTALTNYSLMTCFTRRLPNLAVGNPTVKEFDLIWQFFQRTRKISTTIEHCFGKILNLSHFNNLLAFVTVLIKMREKEYLDSEIVWLVVKIIKASIAYYVSSKASGKNKDIERWMFDWQLMNPKFDAATLSRIHLAMLDLMREPIGVGRDQFYIDGGFISKFVGSIVSFFLFRLQAKETDSNGKAS